MEEKRFTLRMDGELFNEITEFAALHRRSVAKEIELAVAKYLLELRESEVLVAHKNTDGKNEANVVLEEISALYKKYRIRER